MDAGRSRARRRGRCRHRQRRWRNHGLRVHSLDRALEHRLDEVHTDLRARRLPDLPDRIPRHARSSGAGACALLRVRRRGCAYARKPGVDDRVLIDQRRHRRQDDTGARIGLRARASRTRASHAVRRPRAVQRGTKPQRRDGGVLGDADRDQPPACPGRRRAAIQDRGHEHVASAGQRLVGRPGGGRPALRREPAVHDRVPGGLRRPQRVRRVVADRQYRRPSPDHAGQDPSRAEARVHLPAQRER